MGKRIKLQLFFIALKFFNLLYKLFFFWSGRYLLLIATGSKIGKRSCIQACRFFGFGGLTVGDNTIINSGCYLDARRGLAIGNNVVIVHDTKIYTLGHDVNSTRFETKGAPVVIEDYVVVFSNALIMPGVTLKKGAVVLPGSVVTKDVGPMTIVGGNPAKPVKMRETLHTDKEIFRYWFSI